MEMPRQTRKTLRFLQGWIINTLAVLVAVAILSPHITYGGKLENLLIVSLLLGILNSFVRPILMLIALPLLIFTLGLFMLVINALMLGLLTLILPFFHIKDASGDFSFGYAFLAALIISIVSLALNALTGNSRVTIRHNRPPGPPKPPGSGGGPVIDV
jgi:putative membrane protein